MRRETFCGQVARWYSILDQTHTNTHFSSLPLPFSLAINFTFTYSDGARINVNIDHFNKVIVIRINWNLYQLKFLPSNTHFRPICKNTQSHWTEPFKHHQPEHFPKFSFSHPINIRRFARPMFTKQTLFAGKHHHHSDTAKNARKVPKPQTFRFVYAREWMERTHLFSYFCLHQNEPQYNMMRIGWNMLLEKNKPDPVRKNPIQKVFNLYSNLNGINHSMMFFLFDC